MTAILTLGKRRHPREGLAGCSKGGWDIRGLSRGLGMGVLRTEYIRSYTAI